ncbi:hypothetical protein CLIM01_12249 [Colletotrichum limetticola]|uniref:Uncharacterized protein n=1 Tax=Colletotrichum limetticola TaxID=1209924 RepID=A0ABQ9PEA3_9PEZI|nr:hypothetical protein CLIM01_12249 [Colletotrichum limetticola]
MPCRPCISTASGGTEQRRDRFSIVPSSPGLAWRKRGDGPGAKTRPLVSRTLFFRGSYHVEQWFKPPTFFGRRLPPANRCFSKSSEAFVLRLLLTQRGGGTLKREGRLGSPLLSWRLSFPRSGAGWSKGGNLRIRQFRFAPFWGFPVDQEGHAFGRFRRGRCACFVDELWTGTRSRTAWVFGELD